MFEKFLIEKKEGIDEYGVPEVLKFTNFKEEDFAETKAHIKKVIEEYLKKRGPKKPIENMIEHHYQ